MIKKKPVKMVDPPRYPKVTVPLDSSVKGVYRTMLKSMTGMLKVSLLNELKEGQGG